MESPRENGDDRRIFWGLEFSILGSFGGRKIRQVFFSGGLIQVGIFLGVQNNLRIHGSACVSRLRSSATEVQPNKVQHVISFNAFWKFLRFGNLVWDFVSGKFLVQGFFRVLLEAPGIFFGF